MISETLGKLFILTKCSSERVVNSGTKQKNSLRSH